MRGARGLMGAAALVVFAAECQGGVYWSCGLTTWACGLVRSSTANPVFTSQGMQTGSGGVSLLAARG